VTFDQLIAKRVFISEKTVRSERDTPPSQEYQPLLKLRLASTRSNTLFIDDRQKRSAQYSKRKVVGLPQDAGRMRALS
jgi:hypothetical protein